SDVSAETLERVTAIATDLAVSGREGKSIGAMFVIGDHEKVHKRSKQLVLNPFHGYDEEDKNVLNPFMDETIKELSLIDGAFIVRGNGVVETAGSLIQAKADNITLPGGLGTRHAAAAAITQVTNSIALVVSSSGQVTYFRKGRMFTLFEKSAGRTL
ncbi:MAG: diadenylate cyclase, partial [Opitutales bacterium]|nr:diadenylate cyclase [Opitutales bacterium]